MTTERTKKIEKQIYHKPELRIINLAADEVLGVGCKTNTASGTAPSAPCQINSCVNNGS